MNRAAAQSLSRTDVVECIQRNAVLQHPAAARQRTEICAFTAHPVDHKTHDQLLQLLRNALAAREYLLRPGTVEEVWFIEGMFDRLLRLDGVRRSELE